jgi:hypothetical protein
MVTKKKSKDQTWEGFSNEETWYVNLRVTNDSKAERMMRENRPFNAQSVFVFINQVKQMSGFDLNSEGNTFLFVGHRSLRKVVLQELADQWNEE